MLIEISKLNIAGSISMIRFDFIEQQAEEIMKASSIRYIKDPILRDNFFDSEDANGLVSNVDIDFLVDHIEPLEALAWTRDAVN